MQIKFLVSLLLFVILMIGTTIVHNDVINAEAIIEENKEPVQKETTPLIDKTIKRENDTLQTIEDSIFIEKPEIDVVDILPFADTVNVTQEQEEKIKDKSTQISVKVYQENTSSFPNLFHKKISHPLIVQEDSIKVVEYLQKEAYPNQELYKYFNNTKLYQHSDELDVTKNKVLVQSSFGGAKIHAPFALQLKNYVDVRFQEQLYEHLKEDIEKSAQLRIQDQQSQGIIPDIEFPKIKMPKAMRRFFGDNIGRLKVTGSQKITIGGSKTIKKPDIVDEGSKKGFFPDLKMEQKLNLGITGTIGKKIKVDVKQTSDESIFEKNKISIKYVGDEDDPIKLIEAGDTRLSLSGSQFISYSASSEDLFGIKGEFEFGKLKLTAIASQQEGKQASASATGNAVQQETDYLDESFVRNKYFIFDRPDSLFVDQNGLPVDTDTLPTTEWYYVNDKMPKDGQVRVFIDDGRIDPTDITGYDLDGNEYKFYELNDPINDFIIDYIDSPYMIEFGVGISDNYAIGVIYEERSGKKWGSWPQDGDLTVKMIKKNYNVPDEDLPEAKWDYQIKNIYNLGGQNIDAQGFEVKIFYYPPGSAGEAEYSIVDSNNVQHKFIDILKLDTNGDGIVNANDETVDLVKGLITFRMWEPFNSYWFSQYDSTLGNPMVYSELNPDQTEDNYNPFYLSVKSNKVGSTINLGHINIIQGSEKVYVDGVLMQKGTDYDIDYFGGTVRLKGDAASDPNASVKVDFEYEPFFGIEKKSMFGMRADYEFNQNAKVGATFMYEGGASKNKHVQVGKEPKRIFVGDIDGSFKTEMPFMTDLVDKIPLIKTNTKSTMSLSGEIAMNIPDPNTTDKSEAYIDDMEAVNEIFSVGIERTEYVFASYPFGYDSLMADSVVSRGNLSWYNPYNEFHKRDIYPDLPTDEGLDPVTVLECKLQPVPNDPLPSWSGIMKSFGVTAENLEKKRYLELTMKTNDVNPGDTLFIDFGTISEDYYPITHPNNELDTEDLNNDGVLDANEDTGLDGVQGTDPVPPKSHAFDGTPGVDDGNDDYNYTRGTSDYSGINGFEGNGKLNTEDLNRNFRLDTRNNYLEYAIDLNEIDPEIIISEYNGWTFIRIPINDSTYFRPVGEGTIEWKFVEGARLWMKTSTSENLVIDIETFELVGNKWKASAIMDTTLHKPADLQPNEAFEVETENNSNNLDYTPPPGSLTGDDTKEKEIEQSLVLKIHELESDRYIYARENFTEKLDLLNYTRVKMWVYAQYAANPPPKVSNTETIIFRLGADTMNYYEYRKEVEVFDDIDEKMSESRWQDITIDFTEFTNLKKPDTPDTTSHLRIVGNPSLGYIKQVAVGLIRPDSMETTFSGRIYFDDIRVSDPYSESGLAARLTLDTKIADFADIRVNFERKTPNFYSLGASTGSGSDSYSYDLRNNLYLHKFMPDGWGLTIPLKFDYTYSETKPRFKPNSDVKLTTPEEKNEYKTLRETKSASISLKKNKKSTDFFSKIFLDNTFVKATLDHNKSLSPTKRDTTYKYTGVLNYALNFSKNNCIKLSDKFKIYYLPQKITLNTDYIYTRYNSWLKQSQDSLFTKDDKKPDHTLSPKLSVNYELFTDFDTDYTLNMTRDMEKRKNIGSLNIGIETARNQTIQLQYNPEYLKFFNVKTKYLTKYNQNRRENLQNDSLNIQYEVANERQASTSLSLKFNKWGEDLMNLITIEEVVKQEPEKKVEENNTTPEETINMDEIDEKELEAMMKEKEEEKEKQNKENEIDIEVEEKEVIIEETVDSVEVTIDTQKEDEEIVIEDDTSPSFGIKNIASYATKAIGFSIKLIGSTDLSFSSSYNTKYHVPHDSIPDLYYQFGFNDLTYGQLQSTGQTDDFNASTHSTIDLTKHISTDIRAKYNIKFTKNSGNKTKQESITLPQIDLGFNTIDKLLKAKFLSNSSITTSFAHSITNSGNGFWDKPDRKMEKFQFTPILSFRTKLFDKINSTIKCDYSFSNEISYSENNRKTRTNDITANANFTYKFQASKGIKIPLLGRLNMTNKTDIGVDISFNSNKAEYKNPSSPEWASSSDTNTLSIKPRLAYNFSRDINAGLTAEYIAKKNIKEGTSLTTVGLNIWVQFDF